MNQRKEKKALKKKYAWVKQEKADDISFSYIGTSKACAIIYV